MKAAREFFSGPTLLFGLAVLVLALLPLFGLGGYTLHLLITALLWSYIYTCWSLMGRVGLVSFGHGAFIGVGAYTVVLAWNFFGWSPWLTAPLAMVIAVALAAVVGWPCFRCGACANPGRKRQPGIHRSHGSCRCPTRPPRTRCGARR